MTHFLPLTRPTLPGELRQFNVAYDSNSISSGSLTLKQDRFIPPQGDSPFRTSRVFPASGPAAVSPHGFHLAEMVH